jgi:peptide-methionine (R)-S-oxide reductase
MKFAQGLTLVALAGVLGIAALAASGRHVTEPQVRGQDFPVKKSDAEWRKTLSSSAYDVLRHAGTEAPDSSPLVHNHLTGTYYCAGCGQALFTSDAKFESGTGWPSFFKPIRKEALIERPDHSFGMDRTEVLCSRCGGHLGHVFEDGPAPTGLRYCMNGVALKFKKRG